MQQSVGLEQKFDLASSREHIRSLSLALYRVTDKMPDSEPLRDKLRKEILSLVSAVEKVSAGNFKKYPMFLSTTKTLAHYCDIASQQNWLAPENFAVLKEGLLELEKMFGEVGTVGGFSYVISNGEGEAESSDASLTKHHQGGTPAYSSEHTVRTPGEGSADSLALARPASRDTMPARAPRGSEENAGVPPAWINVADLSSRQKALLNFITEQKSAKMSELENIIPSVTSRTLRRDLEKIVKTGYVRKLGRTNRTLYKLVRTS